KVCSKCNNEFPLSEFYKGSGRCKSCFKLEVKEYTLRKYHSDEEFRENVKKKASEWYENNRARVSERNSKNSKSTYEKVKNKERYKELKKLRQSKRRSLKRSAESGFTLKEWKDCLLYFDNRCAYCGAEGDLQKEHFVALSKGGGFTKHNILPACPTCNTNKKAKDFHAWYVTQPFYDIAKENYILSYFESLKEVE
ncbi:MAG TPA: HNH endonuclease signature motif containing protein, partial [Syntrophales bacterium]|nr:HNH endonuclease signature motif containing protein [Syntrophales bacterium]